jgi:nucleotide-binding universal stress UspA family protein
VLYREILVAVDGSRESERALEHAIKLAREEHARLTLVTVIAPVSIAPGPTLTPVPSIRATYGEILANARDGVPDDIGVTTLLLEGSPAKEIVGLTRSGRYDLVVMGTHGRGRLAGALLGSVSRGVLHCAQTPVLLIPVQKGRPGERPEPAPAVVPRPVVT